MATVTGNTGKTYTTNADGSLTVNRPDGTSSTVRQGDANYNATMSAMNADVPKGTSTSGTSYGSSTKTSTTPYQSTTGSYAPGYWDEKNNTQYYYGDTSGAYGTPNKITGATNAAGKSFDLNIGSGSNDWSTAGVGSTGKSYSTSNSNNSIAVTYKDGTTRLVNPGDADYNTTWNAMQTDLKSNGINYVPTHTTTVYRDVVGNEKDGYQIDYSKPSTFQTTAYMPGNADLQKAMQEAARNNGGSISLNDYVKQLYNTSESREALDAELNRLGLSDFNTSNAIYTAGQNILPGGNAANLGRWEYGDAGIMNNGSPQNGLYYTYGGRTYLMGSNGQYASPYADLAQYANGKTGNWGMADYALGNIGNNSMVMGDEALRDAYMNNGAYQQWNTPTGNGSGVVPVGNGNVINNNTLNNAYGANFNTNSTGGNLAGSLNTGGTISADGNSLLGQITQLLNQQLTTKQDYLRNQEENAQANAEDLRHQAWINSQLNEVSTRNRLAGQGLATSGAMDSAMQGVQSNYNTALNDVNTNLKDTLNNLNAQGIQALTDHYNNMTNYTYNITTDEMNRAIENLKLQMQQQEMQMQQQEMEWNHQYQQQQLAQKDKELEYQRKQDVANYAWQLYQDGQLSAAGYNAELQALGFQDPGFYPNGIATNNTATAMALQSGALDNKQAQANIAHTNAQTARLYR